MVRFDPDPDLFFFQPRDEINDLGEVVSDEYLTTIILDALPENTYSTNKVHSVRDLNN